MALKRQLNLVNQIRLDIPHVRMLESAVAADFDSLALLMGGKKAMVVKGFELASPSSLVGLLASDAAVTVANGVLMHPLASEAGSFLTVPAGTAPEQLSATLNAKVEGSFVAGVENYIGLDLRRSPDATTTDLATFLNAGTWVESTRRIPLARTLNYYFVISTVDFSSQPQVAPIAKITTDGSNRIVTVVDCRNRLFRLATGGTVPNSLSVFPWANGRSEVADFTSGDRSIGSLKQWADAMMTRLWEVGGGESWFSATSDRETKLCYGQPVLANNDNFDWTLGTETIEWAQLKLAFANSTAVFNDIEDGTAVLTDGQCLYVDCDRTADRTAGVDGLVCAVADSDTLGSPTVPGSRIVIAWRVGDEVFFKDKQYEAGRAYVAVATTLAQGTVKLRYAAGSGADPIVNPVGVDGAWANVATGGNTIGVAGTGFGSGAGVAGTGGATDGAGVHGTGGATNGIGVKGTGTGSGAGVSGTGGVTDGDGVVGVAAGAGKGVRGTGAANGTGVFGQGGTWNGAGVVGAGVGTGVGVTGTGGNDSAPGVEGTGGLDTSGNGGGPGVKGTGGIDNGSFGGGHGVHGVGGADAGAGAGHGVLGQGGSGVGPLGGAGVFGIGAGGGVGVHGTGGPTGAAGVNGTGGTAGAGVTGTGTTTGSGVEGQGGSTSGIGVLGTGGIDTTGDGGGTGVEGIGAVDAGAGGGVGVRATGGADLGTSGGGGDGVYAQGGAGAVAGAGVRGTGGGATGIGVVGVGGSTAAGVSGTGGAGAAGVTAQGGAGGNGIVGYGSTTGKGAYLEGGTGAGGMGLQAVSGGGAGAPGIQGVAVGANPGTVGKSSTSASSVGLRGEVQGSATVAVEAVGICAANTIDSRRDSPVPAGGDLHLLDMSKCILVSGKQTSSAASPTATVSTAHYNISSIAHSAPGSYDILLDATIDADAVVMVTLTGGTHGTYLVSVDLAGAFISVLIKDTAGSALDTTFNIIAVGRPRAVHVPAALT